MTNSSISLVEQCKLAFMQGCLGRDSFARKVGEYLQTEMRRNDFADMPKIESYVDILHRDGAVGVINRSLLVAAVLPRTDFVTLLLGKDANPNSKNAAGQTAVMLAAHEGYLENVKALHAAGARLHQKDEGGRHALFYALSNDEAVMHLDTINYLLDNDSDPFLENRYGITLDDLVHARHSHALYTVLSDARKRKEEGAVSVQKMAMQELAP
jgi:hypothetical protein